MSIAATIKQDIPQRIRCFPRLMAGLPYEYDSWSQDNRGIECLYYRSKSSNSQTQHTKKVSLNLIVAAVKRFQQAGTFDRRDYRKLCSGAQKSGPCGFAVVGRYLEFRHKAKYQGAGSGFTL
jgi:hypothetical protein